MAQLDKLKKENPELSINIIDILRKFDPSDTGKFTPFLIKQFTEHVKEGTETLIEQEVKHAMDTLIPNANHIEQMFFRIMIYNIGIENLHNLWEFDKHLKSNRVEEKDIQKYETWDDITNSVYLADLKVKEKELRGQIDILYDKDGWFVLKPLSLEASLAYGAGTKWCTASKNNPNYFYQYCTRGLLVYIMNRNNGYKVAMFAEPKENFSKDKRIKLDISFWDVVDNKTESLELDISTEVMDVLRDLVNDRTKVKNNKHFFTQEEIKRCETYVPSKSNNRLAVLRRMDEAEELTFVDEEISVEDIDHVEIEPEPLMEISVEAKTLKRMFSSEQQNPFCGNQNEINELRQEGGMMLDHQQLGRINIYNIADLTPLEQIEEGDCCCDAQPEMEG